MRIPVPQTYYRDREWHGAQPRLGRPPKYPSLLAITAAGAMLAAVVANEFLVARFLSADGQLDGEFVLGLRWMQAVLFVAGIILLLKKPAVLRAFIVGLAMLNLFAFHKRARTAIDIQPALTEGRLRELRQALPAGAHVGYISDDAGSDTGAVGTTRYRLTQYAVAPAVVDLGAGRGDLVIGNFRNLETAQIPEHLAVQRDFGGGLVLYYKTPQ